MATFEQSYEEAVASGLLPGVILLAADKSGDFAYRKCFGTTSLRSDRSKPLDENNILSIASCTKLMTSVAVMQLVERGKLDLDADVATIVPEAQEYGIITGFDDDTKTATFTPNKNTITLRHLLSGSSGHLHEALNPLLLKWRESRNEKPHSGETVVKRFTVPQSFEPGKAWGYGGGWSWAGKMVERVTNLSLEEYMKQNIWDVLGLKDTTFWPKLRADYAERRVEIANVDEATQKAQLMDPDFELNGDVTDCIGGGGLFASAADYLALLTALLREDERILSKASIKTMFQPQLNEEAAAAFNHMNQTIPSAEQYFCVNVPAQSPKNYSMGGMVCMEDQPGWHRKGTVMWSGAVCLIWFIDREAGLCGLAASQVMPMMTPSILGLHGKFQRGIYDLLAEHVSKTRKE